MKKLLSVLLCVLLLAVTATTVFAASSAQMTVSANKTTVYRGDTIDFAVRISTVDDCRSAAFVLNYASSVFEFISGSCSLSGTALASFSAGTGTFAYSSGTTVSGQIFTFRMRVKDTAGFGNHTISANVNTRNSNGAIPTSVNALTVTVACSHSYGAWTEAGTGHQQVCSACGDIKTGTHNWDGGTPIKEADCKEGGQDKFTCTDCGAGKTVDTPKTDVHKYGSWTKVSDTTHKHVCSVCQKEETANHSWNSGVVTKKPTCKEEGVKTFTCTGCGLTRTEELDILTTHTYDHGCDKDCNICGKTRTTKHTYSSTWSKDKTNHYHACTECKDKKDVAPHTPGAEPTETTAQTCTECGYIIKPALGHTHTFAETWTTDDEGHWHACSGCDEKDGYSAHAFENACDPDCSGCGYTREVTHTYGQEWEKDGENHWYVCSACGQKAEEAAHVPGPEATATDAQVCTVCSYELAPVLGGGEDTPEETPASPIWWIIGGAALLAVGGTTVFLILKKKKA